MTYDLPFDSIMVDMTHYPKADNLARTKKLVAYCHANSKATEVEPGRIKGDGDDISDMADLSALMTTYEEAQAFVDAGVDFWPRLSATFTESMELKALFSNATG